MSYPVRQELRDPQLARPVKMWFYLFERTGPHEAVPIAISEPILYETGTETKK